MQLEIAGELPQCQDLEETVHESSYSARLRDMMYAWKLEQPWAMMGLVITITTAMVTQMIASLSLLLAPLLQEMTPSLPSQSVMAT